MADAGRGADVASASSRAQTRGTFEANHRGLDLLAECGLGEALLGLELSHAVVTRERQRGDLGNGALQW